jgi:ferredoxin like protein
MSVKKLSLDERLGMNKYKLDSESHVEVNRELCGICETKVCLFICPAEVYRLVEDRLVFNYENCLECGSCTIACKNRGRGAINWKNPRGGFGIVYRYG